MKSAVYWCSDSSYLFGWTGNIMHLFIYISFWNVQVLLHTLDLFSFCLKKKEEDVFTRTEDFLYKIFRPWNTTPFLLNEH